MTPPRETTARLLISCPDRPGIIAAVTGFLYRHGANCTTLDQHATDAPRMAIFVSKHDHVLMDLLWRLDRGDLYAEVAMVISNHPDLEDEVARFGIPYYHVPMVKAKNTKGKRVCWR